MAEPTLKFIEGARIYLRPLCAADAEGAYPSWLNDAVSCGGNSHHVFPYTREAARAYIEAAGKSREHLILAIVWTATDEHVGNIALQNIHPIYRSADFSILIGSPNARGMGVGREALQLLLAHGFRNLNLHRIACGTFSNNPAMQKTALALGMREEGVRRQAVFKEGEYLDIHEYGILAAEYEAHIAKQKGTGS